jgi:hypothetical protein
MEETYHCYVMQHSDIAENVRVGASYRKGPRAACPLSPDSEGPADIPGGPKGAWFDYVVCDGERRE